MQHSDEAGGLLSPTEVQPVALLAPAWQLPGPQSDPRIPHFRLETARDAIWQQTGREGG
jgi:hypothetical protein